MRLWLDDVRHAPPAWTWAKTCDEAIEAVQDAVTDLELITVMSLDHDLGGNIESGMTEDEINYIIGQAERTGFTFVEWIRENFDLAKLVIEDCEIYVHSWNIVGAQAMTLELTGLGLRAHSYPYSREFYLAICQVR